MTADEIGEYGEVVARLLVSRSVHVLDRPLFHPVYTPRALN